MDDAQPATIDTIRDYYGKVLKTSADLKTSACCLTETLPPPIAAALADVHPEIQERFYGCGSPIPPAIDGLTVLDLGCGSGRDCYVLSKLVGPNGRVIGVDMTAEQLDIARKHAGFHAERFGFANVDFREGYIEDLRAAGIADESVDLVISNCVINLSPDKARVFREIFRVLKPGGELYFSDVFADRRIPSALARDPILLGECLGGAMYIEDFRRLMAGVGCADARFVSRSRLALNNPDIERKVGFVAFESITVRAFKLALEDRCEDYGQVATYRGSLPECPHAFDLDDHHHFVAGKPMLVCGNTADMVGQSRYGRHFSVTGDKTTHFGIFDCAPGSATKSGEAKTACC